MLLPTCTHIHTYTHAVQDPSVTATTSRVCQDDYNPFANEGPPEEEPAVKEVVFTISLGAVFQWFRGEYGISVT